RQELAGQVSEQLMDDGADVVTGCFNSDATLSATAATEREGVPFVITVAASDRILKGRDMNYTYRLQPTTFHYARDWARFYPELVRGEGHTLDTYAHYYIDNAYGSEIFEYIRDDFGPQNDLELVESTAVTLDQSDANAQVTRIREADPDGVVLTGYQQDALMFFNALADLEWRPTWLSASASVALVSADQIEQIGEPAEGIMDANYALNPNNDLTDSFKSEYSDFADRSPTPEAGLAWSTCQVIFDAAERAGSTDPDALNDAIAATDMGPEETPIALDGVAFQDNGENEHALAAMNQVRDGTPTVVYPEEFAAMDPLIEPGNT
ncbi:MAG: ABC transporter substrate-binding protein, partial [Haloplanus sp.]